MSAASATPSDVLNATPCCASTSYSASRTPSFGSRKCPTTWRQPAMATTPKTAILSQRAELGGFTNRKPPSGRGADRGGARIQNSAGSKHQRRLDDIVLQQVGAESAFLRDARHARIVAGAQRLFQREKGEPERLEIVDRRAGITPQVVGVGAHRARVDAGGLQRAGLRQIARPLARELDLEIAEPGLAVAGEVAVELLGRR